MNLQNVRWPFILVGLMVTLGMLFGGDYAWGNHTVDEPLKTLYTSSPAVASFAVENGKAGRTISVKLHKVPDLATVYRDLDKNTGKLLGDAVYTITIEDSRTPALEAVWSRLNLYVQEALMTGNFAEMADRVGAEAGAHQMQAHVSVDSERVYIQLEQGDAVLYEVLARPTNRTDALEGGKLW